MPGGVLAVSHEARFSTNLDTSHLGLEILVTGRLSGNVSLTSNLTPEAGD